MSAIKNHFHDEICRNADKEREEARIRDMEFDHEFDLLVNAAEECMPVDTDKLFYSHMKKEYGDFDLCGLTYIAASVLQRVDPDKYSEMKGDWAISNADLIQIGGSFYNKSDIDSVKEDF